MLIALTIVALAFAFLWSFTAFHNEMLREENAFLLRRALRAEWEAADAKAARVQAEQDALSANAEAVEVGDKVTRLSARVANLLRQSAHDVHVVFQPTNFYNLHRPTPKQRATAHRPEAN